MTDEEKRVRYQNIVYRLSVINSRIENLNNSISVLKKNIKKNITIDGEGLKEDTVKEINTTLESASVEIKGNIIPSLKNKMYS